MHVAFTDDLQVPNNANGKFPEAMIIVICESLTGSDDDAFSGMDSQRIKVLHVADGDAIIRLVPDHFIFHFLPAGEILLHQNLWRVG